MIIYKVVERDEWASATAVGVFRGSAVDLQDGFIHLSTAQQLRETVAKHFVGQQNLLLLGVNAEKVAATLKWETSRNGELFPHIYGDLPISAVVTTHELPLGEDGQHEFPIELPE